jgi:sulfate adenylyltransferase
MQTPTRPMQHTRDSDHRIAPHGGRLVNLFLSDSDAARRRALAASCAHAHECSERNACDVELLAVGGFSPLTGFMRQGVYDHVVKNMR